MPIKAPWLSFNKEQVNLVPEANGAFELADEKNEVILIGSNANLRQGLAQYLDMDNECLAKTRFFRYEEVFQYTLRENELLQQYMRQYKKFPLGNDEIV